MSLEAAFRAYLVAAVPRAQGRVWWLRIPQGATVGTGAVVIQRVATVPTYAIDGWAGYVEAVMQVDCWAVNAAEVLAVADEVAAAVRAYSDPPAASMMGDVRVHMMRMASMRDIEVPEVGLDLYRRTIDVEIIYSSEGP